MQAFIDQENQERSLRRTQAEIADLIECNDFQWFGTLTLDPKKLDRYDSEKVKLKVKNFLDNLRRISPEVKYLLVPERHKDGALHFHALFAHLNAQMSDSGRKYRGQPIYNLKAYRLGFSNFTEIRDLQKTANYCRKYITKELIAENKHSKRYWASKNLARPQRIENLEFSDLLSYPIDLSKAKTFENEHIERHTFPLNRKATTEPTA